MALAVGFAVADAGQDFLFGFDAETGQGSHPPLGAGGGEGGECGYPELIVERFDLFGAQAGDFEHLDEAGFDRGLELLEQQRTTGGVELLDLLSQSGADALDGL